MRTSLTPKQVAAAIGVSQSSLKRWCDKGLLRTVRTAGGHRRLALADVLQFLRQTQQGLPHPEQLGLPSSTGGSPLVFERAFEAFCDGLARGDETTCRRVMFDLYLGGKSVVELGDRLFARAFCELGTRWEHGALEVYEERRGVELAQRLLFELRGAIPQSTVESPRALGGTPEGDPYRLPTLLVELALREAGWQAASYGVGLPLDSLAAAVIRDRPRLVWLSVSYVPDSSQFLRDYQSLFDVAQQQGAALAVGGNGLSERLRSQMRFSAWCGSLQQLVDLAASLWRPADQRLQAG